MDIAALNDMWVELLAQHPKLLAAAMGDAQAVPLGSDMQHQARARLLAVRARALHAALERLDQAWQSSGNEPQRLLAVQRTLLEEVLQLARAAHGSLVLGKLTQGLVEHMLLEQAAYERRAAALAGDGTWDLADEVDFALSEAADHTRGAAHMLDARAAEAQQTSNLLGAAQALDEAKRLGAAAAVASLGENARATAALMAKIADGVVSSNATLFELDHERRETLLEIMLLRALGAPQPRSLSRARPDTSVIVRE